MMPIAIIGLLGTYSFSMYIYTHILFIDSIASDSIPAFLIEINSWLSSCFSKTWNFVTLYLAITAGKGHNNFSHISCRWLSIHFNRHSIWWFVRCYIVFYPHYILSNSASSWCQLIEWPWLKGYWTGSEMCLSQSKTATARPERIEHGELSMSAQSGPFHRFCSMKSAGFSWTEGTPPFVPPKLTLQLHPLRLVAWR